MGGSAPSCGLPVSFLDIFCKELWTYSGKVPKKDKVWQRRCIAQARLIQSGVHPWKIGKAMRSRSSSFVPRHLRARKSGLQGRLVKAAMLRESLFDWFLSIRGAVATRNPTKIVLLKAKALASDMLREMQRLGKFVELPVINRDWLCRWLRDDGISLRLPNRRFKCRREVLLGRLRSMWLTNIRTRALAICAFRSDPTIWVSTRRVST